MNRAPVLCLVALVHAASCSRSEPPAGKKYEPSEEEIKIGRDMSHAFWRADSDIEILYGEYRIDGVPSNALFSRRAIESIESKRKLCAANKADVDGCDINFLTCMVGRPAHIEVTTWNIGPSTSPRQAKIVFWGADGTKDVDVTSIHEDERWKIDEVKCPR